MDSRVQAEKAQAFRRMHDRAQILVLPNAWDAASARVIETAGARAIATTSAGVANALGYSDGQFIPRDEAIAAVARIARVVRVPLSADIEAGFAADAKTSFALRSEVSSKRAPSELTLKTQNPAAPSRFTTSRPQRRASASRARPPA